ncbi:MAG: YcaO-like family protein [Desulfovibrionaceae bacterium]|nr:YcaO-like family protein [Desulfovibrionaceae bacterium]
MQLDYTYTHDQTRAGTGYFSCEPPATFTFAAKLKALETCPLDTFMHRHMLQVLREQRLDDLKILAHQAYAASTQRFLNVTLAALLLEVAYLFPDLAALKEEFPPTALHDLACATPLIYLRFLAAETCQYPWEMFAGLVEEHKPLPALWREQVQSCYAQDDLEKTCSRLKIPQDSLAALHASMKLTKHSEESEPSLNALYRHAMDVLLEAGILAGGELRHESSLSPVALLRNFNLDITVQDNKLNYTLHGTATAYGRGLSILLARLSCVMEIVERSSAYVSVRQNADTLEILDRQKPLPVLRASLDELERQNIPYLPLHDLVLEAQVPKESLTFVKGETSTGDPMWVPAQCVFLFWNVAEPELFLAPGSTGLAAGASLAQAKVHALCEVFERDAQATMPYNAERCFTLKSRDPRLQGLLDVYAQCGIYPQFQDLTTEMGVPVYQCFVQRKTGGIVQACACDLSGVKACLAALTETPWPYSVAHPVMTTELVAPDKSLPTRFLEDLPNYSLATHEEDLALLEGVLHKMGCPPVYVDITRQDLELPCVRAIVPHFELSAELGRFVKPNARLVVRCMQQSNVA